MGLELLTETRRMKIRNAIYNIIFNNTYWAAQLADSRNIVLPDNPNGIKIYKAPLTWKVIKKYPAAAIFHIAKSEYAELNFTEKNCDPIFLQVAIQEKEPDLAIDLIDLYSDRMISTLLAYPNLDGTCDSWVLKKKGLVDPSATGSVNFHTYINMIEIEAYSYSEYRDNDY